MPERQLIEKQQDVVSGARLAAVGSFFRLRARYLVFTLAALIAAAIILMPTPEGLTPEGQRAVAILVLCLILWVTQVLPLMITSLLAIVLFPLLGVMATDEVFPFFANQAVFFILGAFMLASAVMRSGLSSRIALRILDRFGKTPRSLMHAVMLIPAALSLFMPEHAVAALMFPVVLEITESLSLPSEESRYAKGLFVSMAWGAIVGGIGTFLGGARAPLAVGILSTNTGRTISFVEWSLATLPTVIVLLVVASLLMGIIFRPEVTSVTPAVNAIRDKVEELGRVSRREVEVALVMTATVVAWITLGDDLGLATIALAAVALAFALGLMTWKEVEEDVNWGVFLMYGGAIALGYALNESGAARWLVDVTTGTFTGSALVAIAVISLVTTLLTEAMSNSAVVALLLPVGLTFSTQAGLSPELMTLAIAVPSGLAFMLPMGSPPNAIAFSSGHLRPVDTVKAGALMNLTAWICLVLSAAFWWPVIGFGH